VTAYLLIDLNPVWDQIIYTPVHSLKETLLLEVMDYQNLTKDRSLGTVELKVNELAREKPKDAGDPLCSFESTGREDKSEPIRLDRGNQYKGELHYVAEFLPAFTLQDVQFETNTNELQTAVEGAEDGDDVDSDSESSSIERHHVSRAITATEPIGVHKNGKTVTGREGFPSSGETPEVNGKGDVKRESEGTRMSKDELLSYRTW
jgi:Ca2+-dependent lipid-binding protein